MRRRRMPEDRRLRGKSLCVKVTRMGACGMKKDRTEDQCNRF